MTVREDLRQRQLLDAALRRLRTAVALRIVEKSGRHTRQSIKKSEAYISTDELTNHLMRDSWTGGMFGRLRGLVSKWLRRQ